MQFFSLDQLVAADHKVRFVWDYVNSLNLDEFYATIKVSPSQAGHPAISPEVLLALWFWATIEGVGSARELERRTKRDIAYLWICGGVSVNYHTLSDFRSNYADKLEKLLVNSIAALAHLELISMEVTAQDGMRVRANAGKSSFRRKPTLEELQKQVQEHLENLKKKANPGPNA
jgi:transposase